MRQVIGTNPSAYDAPGKLLGPHPARLDGAPDDVLAMQVETPC